MLRWNFNLKSKNLYRYWTPGAIDCYKRGCVCKGCLTGEIIGIENCRMKEAVINLVKFLGLPPQKEEEDNTNILKGETIMYDEDLKLKYPNSMDAIVAAVKKGYVQPKDIAKETAMTLVSINTRFFEFAKYLKTHGLIIGNDTKSNRQRVVDFIQSRLLDNDYIERPKTQERPVRVVPKEDVDEAKNESDYMQLKTENEQLKARIKDLENKPANVDLTSLKVKIRAQITHLTNKLNLIETLEKELAVC